MTLRAVPLLVALFVFLSVLNTVFAQEGNTTPHPLPADSSNSALGNMPIRSLSDTNIVLLEREPELEIDYWRLSAVGIAAAGTLGASYWYVKETWWDDGFTDFHFDSGNDLKYAGNIDKAAHFYGGVIAADLSYGAMRWSGMTVEQAKWYGLAFGVFVQVAIEVKDGYSPNWGFSLWDVGSGTLGSLFPVAQYYVKPLEDVDIKWSYWERTDKYYRIKPTGTWNDDYINQTYWASTRIDNLVPDSWAKVVPDWLAVAVGVGVDETLSGIYKDPNDPRYNPGNTELYLALDVDITQILPSDSPFWEAVKHYLNYIKFPAPAIRITPSVIGYGIYF